MTLQPHNFLGTFSPPPKNKQTIFLKQVLICSIQKLTSVLYSQDLHNLNLLSFSPLPFTSHYFSPSLSLLSMLTPTTIAVNLYLLLDFSISIKVTLCSLRYFLYETIIFSRGVNPHLHKLKQML